MTKKTLLTAIQKKPLPAHIAIILDGNGRWAKKRGMNRNLGHRAGAKNLFVIAKYAYELGIKALTVYAFSTENWNRPEEEVNYLMSEALRFKEEFKESIQKYNFRVNIIGERERLNQEVLEMIDNSNSSTKNNTDFYFTICLNYGSQQEIVQAIKKIASDVKNEIITTEEINQELVDSYLYTKELPPLDLLIRTSGEQRISNFLLWQLAYAELYFTKTFWPDFNHKSLLEAIYNYQQRNRRFGGIKAE